MSQAADQKTERSRNIFLCLLKKMGEPTIMWRDHGLVTTKQFNDGMDRLEDSVVDKIVSERDFIYFFC